MSEDTKKVIYSMIKVSKFYDKKPVIKDISLSYFYGAKIGVLGLNGAGKSSLLRILAGEQAPDRGSVSRAPGDLRLGYLPQGLELEPEIALGQILRSVGGDQQALDVVWCGRRHHLDPRCVDKPGLQTLGVLRSGASAGTSRGADHHRDTGLAPKHEADLGRLVHDLVERHADEVHEHDVDDRPQTRHGRAHAEADDLGGAAGRADDIALDGIAAIVADQAPPALVHGQGDPAIETFSIQK